ncbi:MAG TPA: 23S rRNA (uracil(1939)-C(5))-methyltransferase RlmD [bacterium]|nr:23S rRNA (uracil(1939)-C(5))-methyltransferase RlmD [bacterium]HPP30689.1 23S rRNA (uracil(1939)-C(5))-methyltransferase RlmD [bacterium]
MAIILASKSPRRQGLLKKIVDDFVVIPSDVDETSIIKEADPLKFAVDAAVLKAKDVGKKYPSDTVIGADTVVAIGNTIIGKPIDENDARRILEMLSGTRHRVITGLAVYRAVDDKILTGYEISYVKFKKLSPEEIEEELAKNEYMDKAGAYAIQSVGDRFVEELKGDYDNVVGLPVKKLKGLLNLFNQPEREIEIVDMAFPKNWAVGRSGGMVIFVPDAVYGDKVRVFITERKKNFAYGKVIKIIQPSPYRVEPLCKHFGLCGGCVLQNLRYENQLELKSMYLLNTIRKIAGKDVLDGVEVLPIIPSPDIFFYRNKMEFAFGSEKNRIFLGLRKRGDASGGYHKNTVPLSECSIFSEVVKKIFPVVSEFAERTGLGVYNPYTGEGFFRHLVIREGKNTGELMVILVTKSGEIPDMTKLMDKLPLNVKSLWWVENNRISDVVAFERKHHLYGDACIEEKMGEMKFRIAPQSFFQPNTKASEVLYSKIREDLEDSGVNNLLGLYCGSGVMEIYLSSSVKKVTGIDIEPSNIATAEENCRINNIKNCHFYQCSVEDMVKRHRDTVKDVDAIIVDPPRAGLSKKAMKNVTGIGSKKIIYVSCNVSAFARDTAGLREYGYFLEKLYCVDFFPHTTHLESMGVFGKKVKT